MLVLGLNLALPLAAAIAPARSNEIIVMSGAAVEAGLVQAVEAFRQQRRIDVTIVFATTPQMRWRVNAGETPDVVIAPPALLDELAAAGRIDGAARVAIGQVGIGVAIRRGAPKPDVSTTEALTRAILEADSLVYNHASSGLYVEELFVRLGLAEQLEAKTKRYAGTDMVEPLVEGTGYEIGFMPVAEILHFREKGLELVGPLPAEIQHYTAYAAAPASGTTGAREFVRFLDIPATRQLFASAGIK